MRIAFACNTCCGFSCSEPTCAVVHELHHKMTCQFARAVGLEVVCMPAAGKHERKLMLGNATKVSADSSKPISEGVHLQLFSVA